MDRTLARLATTNVESARGAFASASTRDLTTSTFQTLSYALEVLEGHRRHMESSRAALTRARALFDRLAGEAAVLRPPGAPHPGALPPGHASCGRVGCGGPALYRPCFVLQVGGRTLRIDSVPLAVCAAHRDLLAVELATPRVLEALRDKVRARRGVEDVDIDVWFQTLQ